MYYVYVHYKKDSGEPFYVGKGTARRAYRVSGRSMWWQRTVAKHGFYTEILFEFSTEQEAFNRERSLIDTLCKKYSLCNLTKGGEGSSGYKQTLDHIQKRVATRTKQPKNKDQWGSKNSAFISPILATNLKTGKSFELDFQKHLSQYGFNRATVYKCLAKKRKQHKGFKFERIINANPSL